MKALLIGLGIFAVLAVIGSVIQGIEEGKNLILSNKFYTKELNEKNNKEDLKNGTRVK